MSKRKKRIRNKQLYKQKKRQPARQNAVATPETVGAGIRFSEMLKGDT